ncbi:outer membrane lipoprotein-sorting protein [Methylocucumis oryzae]|uniref:outer membrane lipoprotein-sorting protein n=1 Tax=Methylocucumis oryzae TaxID=1632867 RepID=UPI0009E53CC4|nr:outer membrane lipoprotein-sorting protein [Methylocucumis oryzae]
MKKILLNKTWLLMLCLAAPLTHAEPTGREILDKMTDFQRSITDSAFVKSKLSSCQYGIKDKRITCVEEPRVKLLEAVGINDGVNRKDTKSVTVVLEPAIEKGVGMLNYTYDEAGKDNETWLYLSALGRVKRIASGNSEDDSEPASLFGSEFTTEDTDPGKLDEYTITLLGEATEAGRPVWKIETVPNAERAKKTRYARTVLYVDKERYVSLRSEMYDKNNKEIKRMITSKVDEIKRCLDGALTNHDESSYESLIQHDS